MELSSSQKAGLVFGGAFVVAGLVLSTLVFPFWNLIREDVSEEVEILSNDNGICYVETRDDIPKTIENCIMQPGDVVTIMYGEGLAWATITEP
ncbi:hypothetical protein Nisw_08365 [Candidatus Nitrosopumilus sp. SW]|uniref:hypothetical protein n=1 Tax=Candidatus Nitrosopumilus sp. SW TaxID=2508726 RepID=UPI001153C549|nr:hypothetical protein [Candidatus Nitrosopumilus sp. SW]QDI89533.1 hypothetical protein Nisw_08365 [Candidatus Nitrosopumilus sp. SW]